jgi:tetratricopeptide (TPR) repeat protein
MAFKHSARALSRRTMIEVVESVRVLSQMGQFDVVRRTLELALVGARDLTEQTMLLEMLEGVPEWVHETNPAWALLRARLLCNTRQSEALLSFTSDALKHEHLDSPGLRVLHAWALVQAGQCVEGLGVAEEALPVLPESEKGFAWRTVAEARSVLGVVGWHEAFDEACLRLEGRALGTCLIAFGYHLERHGEAVAARRVWLEALGLMAKDAYYLAWIHFDLGRSYVRELHPEAESHMLEAQRLARTPRAVAFASRAALGVGLVRRVLGEWSRAEASYREAVKLAVEPFDRQQALRGLGHTLRLANQPSRALEPLLEATRCWPSERMAQSSWVFADVAAAQVQLGDVAGALEALEHTGEVRGEDLERTLIVRAELARRERDANTALELLRDVRFGTLWAREESTCFAELFKLGDALGLGVPESLPRPNGLHVQVNALGVLRVRVNGRDVPIKPVSRAGELLVLLLERGGSDTVEHLLEALYPNVARFALRGKKQALSGLVRDLRAALGWEGSVQALGGAYRLDPDAHWDYDVREARVRGEKPGGFLEGVYTDWARQTERALRDPDWLELN